MIPTETFAAETETLVNPVSSAPPEFNPCRDLPAGFMDFFLPLHRAFTARQQELARERAEVLQRSLEGDKPNHHFPSDTVRNGWRITLPDWCQDQRNQMTGPADDGELCVKMLNSGAPGVMLDLEDSCVNAWEHHETGVANILACSARPTHLLRQEARPHGHHSAEQHGHLHAAARAASQPGRLDSGRTGFRVPVRRGARLLRNRSRAAEASALHLHSEVRIRGRSAAGGAICSRRSPKGAGCRTTTSSAWRWSNRTRSRTRWKSSPTTCASTSSA